VTGDRVPADAATAPAPIPAASAEPVAEPEPQAPLPHVRVSRLESFLESVLFPGASVAVVDSGVPALLELGGRRAWSVPGVRTEDPAGAALGTATALAQLEELRDEGAQFLVIPAFRDPSWLDEHPTFTREVERLYCKVADRPHLCSVYDLTRPSPTRRDWKRRLANLLKQFGRRAGWERPNGIAS